MNLLFVYSSEIIPEHGGVQRVTSVLADYFEKQKNRVFFISSKRNDKKSKSNFRQYFLPIEEDVYNEKNILFYTQFVKDNKIDIVINQEALGGGMVRFCSYAKEQSNVKIISVIHNSLLGNVLNFVTSHERQIKKIPIPFLITILDTTISKRVLKYLYTLKYRMAYKFTYSNSDKIILLSNGFYDELKHFVPDISFDNVLAIPNPCTIAKPVCELNKINEILYVGRIDVAQKKVDILLKVWEKIYKNHPNWSLSIVGDGIEKSNLENNAIKIGLERIKFLGQQNPIPFYERAKFLCMTSAYEGFPLVLAEAQVYGTIPIAFNSFASVGDIIKDNENGFLVEPFNINEYASILSLIMENKEKTNIIAENCQKSAKLFSIDYIGGQWIDLFKKILN